MRRDYSRVFKAGFIAGMIGLASLASGFYSGPQRMVEEIYVVEPGDTLWSIGEEYREKNTGGRRYLPEFISGIRELNPWLLETHDQIQPGDKLRINYWIAP